MGLDEFHRFDFYIKSIKSDTLKYRYYWNKLLVFLQRLQKTVYGP